MRVSKAMRLDQLQTELAAAGVVVPALGIIGEYVNTGDEIDLHTYDATGAYLDLPAAAAPVVAAHVPQPTDQEADVSQRATLVQQAQAAYQTLAADLATLQGATGTLPAAQLQAMLLHAQQALALSMRVQALVARIMVRDRT